MGSTINDKLPRELIGDILLRLPVKVITQCKCVCKHWCSFIESPSFIKQHFEYETNKEHLLIRLRVSNQGVDFANFGPNQNGLVFHEPSYEQDEQYALLIQDMMINQEAYFHQLALHEEQLALEEDGEFKRALYVDETFSEYEVPYPLQMPDEVTDLIGPLNGVFCVVRGSIEGGPMALLNPALRQFKPLPLIQHVCPQSAFSFGTDLGFGLDPLTGDYKLVMLIYFLNSQLGSRCVAYVCTSESDSWRLLEDVDLIMSGRRVSRSHGVTYLNGVYYWLFESSRSATNVSIMAFDMVTEKFRKIQVMGPKPQSSSEWLALCGESLTLLTYDQNERCMDIWMMENEGCWIRRSRVGSLDSLRRPLCLWKNDLLLLEKKTGLMTRYNISTEESEIIEAPKIDRRASVQWVFVYKESLVSIMGEAGKCKLWDPSSDFIKNFFKDSSSQEYS